MDRNPISDLEALAAMPGLEALADVLLRHLPPRRITHPQAMGLLILLGGRWTWGSANTCASALLTTEIWEHVKKSALRVGRALAPRPPTYHQYEKVRREFRPEVYHDLSVTFTKEAVALAKLAGLLRGGEGATWNRPNPGDTIYGDGSVVSSMTDVYIDDDGVAVGSRARSTPRPSKHFLGKKGDDKTSGIPIALVGTHGRRRWARVILGIDIFEDRNEIRSALDLMRRVIDEANGGVTHVVYDRLMSGRHIRELMNQGVIPVVEMTAATANQPHVELPYELQHHGYRTMNRYRKSGEKVAPKTRLQLHHLGTHAHQVNGDSCYHELFALDGAVVAVKPGEEVSLDADYVFCRDVHFESGPKGQKLLGELFVSCRGGGFTVGVDFTASRPGSSRSTTTRDNSLAMADYIRPIPEVSPFDTNFTGLRSDVESTFSSFKDLLHRERAGSLDVEHFFLDLVGAGLLCNAIAWDVHVAQHTNCARHEAMLDRRGKRAKTVTFQ